MLTAAAILTLAFAPGAHALTPADQQELKNFTLTEDFLHRFTAVAKEAHDSHTDISVSEKDPHRAAAELASLDTITANIAKNPKTLAMIEYHGLTPRQLVDGSLVLMRALLADAMLANPSMAKYVDPSKTPSPANMAFVHNHKAEIAAMDAMLDDD